MFHMRIALSICLSAALVAGPLALAQEASVSPAVGNTSASVAPDEDPDNWRRIAPENLLRFLINGSTVLIELRPDVAPAHVAQIKSIVRNGHYDGLPFHRVIDDFMAQGGEVASVYSLPQPYPSLEPEFVYRRNPSVSPVTRVTAAAGSTLTGYADGLLIQSQPESIAPLMEDGSVNSWVMHCPGIASMARADAPNSADTQFFLMRQAQNQLDTNYTVWGRVVAGLDVVRAIKAGPEETDGRLPPDQADRLMRAEIVADLPTVDQPVVYVQRTDTDRFQARLAETTEGSVQDPCSLPPIPVIVETPERG